MKDSLYKRIQKHYLSPKTESLVCVILLVFLSLLELLAFKFRGAFSFIASRLWLLGFFTIVLVILCEFFSMLYRDIRKKSFFTPAGFLLIVLLLLLLIGNLGFSDISYEAALQVQGGMESFSQRDWGYTGTAFLGYPVKQYLLNALPTVLFGRSIASLQTGFAFLFILGLAACFMEARYCLRKYRLDEKLSLLPVILIASSPYIVEFYLIYEQCINPVSFTMLALASYLRFKRKPSVFSAFALAWSGNLLYNSYSPGASSFMLLCAFMGLDLLHSLVGKFKKTVAESGEAKHTLLLNLSVFLTLVFSFISVSVAGRKDNLFSLREDITAGKLLKSLVNFFTDSNALFLGLLSGAVLVYVLLSLTGFFGIRDFVISCWVMATALFSEYLVGYKTAIDMHLLLQRSMVVIPVLCFALFIHMAKFLHDRKLNIPVKVTVPVFAGLYAVLVFSCFKPHNAFTYMNHSQAPKYVIDAISKVLKDRKIDTEDSFSILYYTESDYANNLWDYTPYFYPNAKLEVIVEVPEITDEPVDMQTVKIYNPEENVPNSYLEKYEYFYVRLGQTHTIYLIN